MSQSYDNDADYGNGVLPINSYDDSEYFTHKQTMLYRELALFKETGRPISNMQTNLVTRIIDEISNNLNTLMPGDHNMTCHSKNHGSTGGGTGFGKSYSKRC